MIGHVLVNTDEVITNEYTYSHDALDLVGAGKSISDVISLEDGVVELVVSNVVDTDRSSTGIATYGNVVKIRHANGQKTLYAHLKYGSVAVKKGQAVSKGQKLGTMGATGNAYGVHLHFEVRNKDETRENPYEYLWGHKKIKTEAKQLSIKSPPEIQKEKPKEDTTIKQEEKVEKQEIKEAPIYKEETKKDETIKNVQTITDTVKEKAIIKEKTSPKEGYLSNRQYLW